MPIIDGSNDSMITCWNCGKHYNKYIFKVCPFCDEDMAEEPEPEFRYDE